MSIEAVMPSNHLILCHLLLPDETPVAVTETPPVFPSMMVIPSSWDDPFTTVWIKIIQSCISGPSVQGPSLDSSGCLEMLTLSFCPPEMGFILTSPSRDVLCLPITIPFLSGFFRNSTFFSPLVMQRFNSLPFSVWTLPGGGVDLTSRFKEALPSLISFLLSLLSHMLCVSDVRVMAMLPTKGASQHRWWKQMWIRSEIVLC